MNLEKACMAQDASAIRSVNPVDKEMIETLISTQAVSFEAIGKTIGSVGSKAVFIDDGWIRWCRSDMRIYRWPGLRLELDRLNVIRELVAGIGNGLGR